jgi:hypothetical protein
MTSAKLLKNFLEPDFAKLGSFIVKYYYENWHKRKFFAKTGYRNRSSYSRLFE